MHEHDIDRIAAVAEHRLTGQDLVEARVEIDACEECRTRLADQLLAISFLKQAPDVSMTAVERARIHRAIRPAPTRSRWLRLAPAFAAAAAVVVVAASAILPRGGAQTMTATDKLGELSQTAERAPGVENDSLAPEESIVTGGAPSSTTLPQQETLYSSAHEFAIDAARLRVSPPDESSSLCAEAAREDRDEAPIAASEIDYNGVPAVMYVYEDTAIIFATGTCDFLEEVPAATP